MITGIRGLCNGLGPALYGFIFYIFHVELDEVPDSGADVEHHPQLHQQVSLCVPPYSGKGNDADLRSAVRGSGRV